MPIDLSDFGAVGDGITDDTAAVQAWLDAVQTATPYGGDGYPPGGRYRLTDSVKITQPGKAVKIEGAGPATRFFRDTATAGPVFEVDMPAVEGTRLILSDFMIETPQNGGTGSCGIRVSRRAGVLLERLFIQGGFRGVDFGPESWAPHVIQCRITDCGYAAIDLDENYGANGAVIERNYLFRNGLASSGYAITITGGNAIVIRGNDIENNFGGVFLKDTGAVTLEGNYIENSTGGSNIWFAGTNLAPRVLGNWLGANGPKTLTATDGLRFCDNRLYRWNLTIGSGNANKIVENNHTLDCTLTY